MTFGPLSLHLPGRTPAEGVPVQMVVVVEAHHGTEVPDVRRQDVTVRQGNERAQVTGFIPLRDDRAGLELFVLIDDASDQPRSATGGSPAFHRIATG